MAKKPAAPRSTKAGHAPANADGTISSAMDYPEHETTYHRFTFLVKWAVISSAVGMVLLYFIVSPMIRPAG